MQQREQWTDGANAFTLSPGKIIGYDCNNYTLKELEKNGYTIITSEDYINNYASNMRSIIPDYFLNKYRITRNLFELL